MEECPQCRNAVEGASSRLVQDSCGHKKCRICLLKDEENCFQCTHEAALKLEQESVIRYEDNHTAVITFKAKDNGGDSAELKCDSPSDVKVKVEDVPQKRNYETLPIPGHISVSLENPAVYTCNVCQKVFKTRSHVKYHQYCAGGNKPHKCEHCDKEFISKSHFETHLVSHTGKKQHRCEKCGKLFAQKGKLTRHSLIHLDSRLFVCQECGKSFRTKDTLRLHTFIHKGYKPYTCKQCKRKFSNSSNLKKHLSTHSKDKVHMCDECGKRFKLKSSLTVHRTRHSRMRPHKCAQCSKAFLNFKDLQRHQMIHIDEKAFSCGICNTGFRRKDNLDRHLKTSHPGSKPVIVRKNVRPKLLNLAKASATVVDNPNAIKVITAPPTSVNNTSREADPKSEKSESKKSQPVPVINAPLKLAFKTDAFKNCYNIHRDYVEPPDSEVNVYERILLPNNPPRIRINPDENVLDVTPKMLPLLNTSFEHNEHAVIKNIKFKLPSKYINLNSVEQKDLVPIQPIKDLNFNVEQEFNNANHIYTDIKQPVDPVNPAKSVIVNTPLCQLNDLHWRKRTAQSYSYQNVGDI